MAGCVAWYVPAWALLTPEVIFLSVDTTTPARRACHSTTNPVSQSISVFIGICIYRWTAHKEKVKHEPHHNDASGQRRCAPLISATFLATRAVLALEPIFTESQSCVTEFMGMVLL